MTALTVRHATGHIYVNVDRSVLAGWGYANADWIGKCDTVDQIEYGATTCGTVLNGSEAIRLAVSLLHATSELGSVYRHEVRAALETQFGMAQRPF